MYFISMNFVKMDSVIVDIGCGVGKSAVALRDFAYNGKLFEGMYHGYDIDKDMIDWCTSNFPNDKFKFSCLDFKSTIYNPEGNVGAESKLDLKDNVVDLVFSQSLFSHLLEADIRTYLEEAFRVLKSGGIVLMTFFCIDDLKELDLLGGRWTFEHKVGSAFVENIDYPEAAVAYTNEFIIELANSCGFDHAEVILPSAQSTLKCVK
ncbi:MAG: class I SAM-dependent methyltransferase [Candidatus Anammoxibacter sp.]